MYVPSDLPELNPTEYAWAEMKERLKAKAERNLESLEAEIEPALEPITAKQAQGRLRNADYILQ